MKKIVFILILISVSCKSSIEAVVSDQSQINSALDSWHKAASVANYDSYFSKMTDDAIFIGTDATEIWGKPAFQLFAKPHFDKGKAWDFIALKRNIYVDKLGKIAWFDELLNTQMKLCRGSGIMVRIGDEWKIKHYVLSMTIPNENSDAVIKIKSPIEVELIASYNNAR